MINLDAFFEVMWRWESVAVMLFAGGFPTIVLRTVPELATTRVWARIAFPTPLILAVLAVQMPGVAPPGTQLGPRILLGIVLGLCATGVWKFVQQTILGRDRRLQKENT